MAGFLGKEESTSVARARLSYVCSLVRRVGSSSCSCRIWGPCFVLVLAFGVRTRTTSLAVTCARAII